LDQNESEPGIQVTEIGFVKELCWLSAEKSSFEDECLSLTILVNQRGKFVRKKKFMGMTVIDDPDSIHQRRKRKIIRTRNPHLRFLLIGMIAGTIFIVLVGLLTVIIHWGFPRADFHVPQPTLIPAITPVPVSLLNPDPLQADEVRQTVSADISADGETLALVMYAPNQTVLQIRHLENYDLANSTVTVWQRMPFYGVQDVRFNADASSVLLTRGVTLGWYDTQLRLTSTGLPLFGVPGGCGALSPDSRVLATCTLSGIGLWDVETEQLIQMLQHPNDYTSDVAFSPDGRLLAAVAYTIPADFGVTIWDMQKLDAGSQSFAITDSSRAPRLAFSPDGRYIARTARNGFQMIDLTGMATNMWDVAVASTERVAFSPDGHWVALVFQDPTQLLGDPDFVGVWSVEDQSLVAAFESRANDVRFSGDNQYLLITTQEKSIVLWDFLNDQVVSQLSFAS
jgi:WD40 repeat protein